MARTKNRFNAADRKAPEEAPEIGQTWRVGIYARLSSDSPTRHSESVENQLEIMRRFISGRPEFTETFEYSDKGYSGTNFNRPDFERMMEDVRSGRINCIIVKDLSRLGRDYLETSNFVETIFPFLGVRFISVNDHFDTSEEHNSNKEMEIALKNLVNDMYARDISKRICTTIGQNRLRGKFQGKCAPYGYRINEDDPLRRFLVDEPAAEVVRSIFRMILDGLTYREVALKLQEQKLSIPKQYLQTGHLHYEPGDEEKRWLIGTLSSILHNPAYIGTLALGRVKEQHYKGEERHRTDKDEWVTFENAHEPIVSEEVYDEVQRMLSDRVERNSFSSGRTKDIPVKPNRYKGILFCGICGEKLTYGSFFPPQSPTERRYYYACRSSGYDLNIENHRGIRITEVTLEKILKGMIGDLLRRFDEQDHKLTAAMEKELKAGAAQWQRDIRKVEHRLTDLDAVSASDYEAYVLGTVTREEFLKSKSTAEEQREKLELELGQMQEKCTEYGTKIHARLRWLKGLNEASEGELDGDLLRLLVERIELYPDHELEITWRFSEEDIMRKDGE